MHTRMHIRIAFYNLPTTALGCKQEIKYITRAMHSYIIVIYVMYKLKILNKLQLVQRAVEVTTCTSRLYKLQLVQTGLYQL